jgi:predicted transcriptional regulator
MKITIEIDPQTYLRLRQLAAERVCSVDEMVAGAIRFMETREERAEKKHKAQLESNAKNWFNSPQ